MDKTKVISVLNDLIKVNQDRINAYKNAEAATKQRTEFTVLFDEIIQQGATFIKELQDEIASYGLSVPSVKLQSTRVYKTWSDFEISFKGRSNKELLAACEYGEAALESVYDNALDETGIPANVVTLILKQKRELRATHYTIKRHRNTQLSVEA